MKYLVSQLLVDFADFAVDPLVFSKVEDKRRRGDANAVGSFPKLQDGQSDKKGEGYIPHNLLNRQEGRSCSKIHSSVQLCHHSWIVGEVHGRMM